MAISADKVVVSTATGAGVSVGIGVSVGAASAEGSGEAKEEKGESDVTKLAVEDLKLTGRTLNALLNNGIKTVGGVIKKSEKSLSELEGMGDKAMSEIKRKIKKLGLELKSEE